MEPGAEPIHIRPPQCKALANAKAEAHTGKRDGAEWFLKVNDEELELFHGEATGFALSLRCALDGDQFHRVPLCRQVTAPHGEIPQDGSNPRIDDLLRGADSCCSRSAFLGDCDHDSCLIPISVPARKRSPPAGCSGTRTSSSSGPPAWGKSFLRLRLGAE